MRHLFTCANLDKAQVLIDVLAHLDFQMVLPKRIPTLRAMATGNYTGRTMFLLPVH